MKVQLRMSRIFFDFFIEQIQGQHPEVDIFSKKFIFNPNYSMARSQYCAQGQSVKKRTVLSLLLHECMNDQRRSAIFPNEFDLGNLREVPSPICTPADLFNYLDLPSDDASTPLKHIHVGIKQLTGQSIKHYYKVSLSNALKVTKTLYYLTRTRKEHRLFSKLASPENGKSGLEFREAYHHRKSRELGYLVADIREYLGAELTTQKITRIQDAFESLKAAYEKALALIQRIDFDTIPSSVKSAQNTFETILSSIEKYQHPPAPGNQVQLDEALYIHITSLPFRHFAQQYPNLHSTGIDTTSLTSLADYINIEDYKLRAIPVNNISEVLVYKDEIFTQIASTLTNTPIDVETLKKYTPLISALINRVEIFEPNQSLFPEERNTSLLRIVTAIAAIHNEHLQKTSHMPYWHGQQAVGDSLLTSLKSDFNDEAVYEEHTQIWRIRLDWLSATLCGESVQYNQRSAIGMLVLRRFSEIARIQNIDTLENATQLFLQHIQKECNRKFPKIHFTCQHTA